MHNNNQRRHRNGGRFNNNGPRNNMGGGNRPFNRNQSFDSVNPGGGRLRGTAQQLMEKYQELARAANAAGDYTLAENQLQHAEHYARVVNEYMDAMGIRHEPTQQDGNDAPEDLSELPAYAPPTPPPAPAQRIVEEQPSLGDFEPPEFLRMKH